MNTYRVEYLRGADLDIVAIHNYIATTLDNPSAASRIAQRILATCEGLSVFPRIGVAKTSQDGIEIRYVHSGKYTIAYTVDDEKLIVTIYAVKYSRMNLGVALGELDVR